MENKVSYIEEVERKLDKIVAQVDALSNKLDHIERVVLLTHNNIVNSMP